MFSKARTVVRSVVLMGVAFGALVAGGSSVKEASAQAANCDAIGCYGTIDQFWIYPDATQVRIRLSHNENPKNGSKSVCSLNNGEYWWMQAGSEKQMSALLAAKLSGQRIYLRLKNGVAECTVDYVLM